MLEYTETTQPYLTISIPTYNRAACLARCLESIVSQLPLSLPIEVWISDNASTDNTQEVGQKYATQYPFMHYRRNSENIGATRNILKLLEHAKGKYIKTHGDDDFFRPGTLELLLRSLQNNEDCSLMFIHVRKNDAQTNRGEGLLSYVKMTSVHAGHISTIVLRMEDIRSLDNKALFADNLFNHNYLQYSVLVQNPLYCVLNYPILAHADMPSEPYSVAVAFMENYTSVLQHFIGKGLTQQDYEQERRESLFNFLIPRLRMIANGRMLGYIDDFKAVYIKNYRYEPYYEEGLRQINAILQA